LLRTDDIALLRAFIAAAQKHDDLRSLHCEVNSKPAADMDSQFKHTVTDRFVVTEISGPNLRERESTAAWDLMSRSDSNHSSNGTAPFARTSLRISRSIPNQL